MSWQENIKAWHIILLVFVLASSVSFGIGKFLYAFDQKKANQCDLDLKAAQVDLVALTNQVVELTGQVNAGFTEQQRGSIQQRIWQMEDVYRCGPRYGNSCYIIIKDRTTKDTYAYFQRELDKINKKLKKIYGK